MRVRKKYRYGIARPLRLIYVYQINAICVLLRFQVNKSEHGATQHFRKKTSLVVPYHHVWFYNNHNKGATEIRLVRLWTLKYKHKDSAGHGDKLVYSRKLYGHC